MAVRPKVPADAVLSVLRHPSLWAEGARAVWSLSKGPLPVPHGPYLAWRTLTAYGDEGRSFDARDLVEYLRWRRRMRRRST